jgi:hypothetical protein
MASRAFKIKDETPTHWKAAGGAHITVTTKVPGLSVSALRIGTGTKWRVVPIVGEPYDLPAEFDRGRIVYELKAMIRATLAGLIGDIRLEDEGRALVRRADEELNRPEARAAELAAVPGDFDMAGPPAAEVTAFHRALAGDVLKEVPGPFVLKSRKTGKTYLRDAGANTGIDRWDWVMFVEEGPKTFATRLEALSYGRRILYTRDENTWEVAPLLQVPYADPANDPTAPPRGGR